VNFDYLLRVMVQRARVNCQHCSFDSDRLHFIQLKHINPPSYSLGFERENCDSSCPFSKMYGCAIRDAVALFIHSKGRLTSQTHTHAPMSDCRVDSVPRPFPQATPSAGLC